MIWRLLPALCFVALAQPAWADYHFDCNSKDDRLAIRGCTQAIASGRPAVLDVVTDVDGIAPPAWNG